MPSDARYSSIEHGGLEVAGAPERDTVAPEVVPGSHPPLERRSSLNHPEVSHPGQYDVDLHGQERGYHDAPDYDAGTRPSFIDADMHKEKPMSTATVMEAQTPAPKRYCGMSKKFFIVAVIVGVVVILAAILGGVLGTVLNKHSSSSSPAAADSSNSTGLNSSTSASTPLQAREQTGLATALSADGSDTLLTYYQDQDGRIIENSFSNGQWSLEDQTKINSSVVTDQAVPGSPLAAISYVWQRTTYRQLFFLDNDGDLVETTSSSTTQDGIATSWSAPETLSTDTALASSIGLAACQDNDTAGMGGIRVYYGLAVGGIQEVGYQYNDSASGWTEWAYWNSSYGDAFSGVACTTYNDGIGDRILNLYFRNPATQQLQQTWWNYTSRDIWSYGPTANESVASGSDIAACNDQKQTEYVFFQSPNGTIERAITQPLGREFSLINQQQQGSNATKLTSTYYEDGALFMFQNDSSSSTMWLAVNSRSDQSLTNIDVT